MYPQAFTSESAGRLVKSLDGYWTFVPNPLPPSFELDHKLFLAVSAAERSIGRLAGVGQTLPNPHLLIGPFVRREAVLSSRIEGTHATLTDLVLFEQSESVEQDVPDVREVSNYVRAMEYGLRRQRETGVGLTLIREMHQLLMQDVRGGDKTPGNFRTIQNFIGRTGRIEEATYVPPSPLDLPVALEAFQEYLRAPSTLPPLVRIALIHYQFEAIHPFNDGNGRIGRLLITLLLCVDSILPMPLLYLSAYLERNRQEYYRRLLAVSQRGEWKEWIGFILEGVRSEAADAVRRGSALLGLQRQYHAKAQKARASSLVFALIDELFSNPAITVASTAKALKVTARAAAQNVERLIKLGILQEATGRKRGRVFVAREVIKVLERREEE